jgi:hypothetical protein
MSMAVLPSLRPVVMVFVRTLPWSTLYADRRCEGPNRYCAPPVSDAMASASNTSGLLASARIAALSRAWIACSKRLARSEGQVTFAAAGMHAKRPQANNTTLRGFICCPSHSA